MCRSSKRSRCGRIVYKELVNYSKTDWYPFHMPGHKRRLKDDYLGQAAKLDITEIDGFDDFHKADGPDGLILELMKRLQGVFGGDRVYISVNGSTALVLAAFHAAVPHGGRAIIASHNHKSVMNGAFLREAEMVTIEPCQIEEFGIEGGISPEELEKTLNRAGKADAVIFPSPTYEGVISDIRTIADICHAHGAALIVDSAHGAHLGLYDPFATDYNAVDAVGLGADLVIKSLHKTLPSFGQTAIAIWNDNGWIDRQEFEKYHRIFQTTSPSYLFFAGIDRCLDMIENEGVARFKRLDGWLRQVREFFGSHEAGRDRRTGLEDPGCGDAIQEIHFHAPCEELIGKNAVFGFDPTKLLLTADGMTGKEIYDELRRNYHIQPERYRDRVCLLLTGMMDDKTGFDRLLGRKSGG